jgi:hypothetical protein
VSIKTKNTKTAAEQINVMAMRAGVVMMAAAATLGMIELPEHPNKIITPGRPAFAFALQNEEENNPLRREREETAPHFISYSEVQRTSSRAGKL